MDVPVYKFEQTSRSQKGIEMTDPKDENYQQLLADVSMLYEQAVLMGERQQSQQKVASFWRMGRRIVDEVQKGKPGAAYGKQVIRQLSEDLTQKYGKGLGRRTVEYMRSFALHYTAAQINTGLSWSHYRTLLSIEDTVLRQKLGQRAIDEELSKEQLIALVSTHLQGSSGHYPSFNLSPRDGTPGVYKVIGDSKDGKRGYLLDCGFGVVRRISITGVSNIADGAYVQLKSWNRKQNTGHFTPIDCAPGDRYCYSATLLKVVDGDTVKLRLQLGFDSFIDEKLRLRGVDAMELPTAEGRNAGRALTRMLTNATTITVYTYSYDRYGRYIADLVVDKNKYINKLLVQKGHARFLNMKAR